MVKRLMDEISGLNKTIETGGAMTVREETTSVNPIYQAARMELEADTWHQTDGGVYYLDCPECGSPATLPNIIAHGRCTTYLDENETVSTDAERLCTAKLSLELVYQSDTE